MKASRACNGFFLSLGVLVVLFLAKSEVSAASVSSKNASSVTDPAEASSAAVESYLRRPPPDFLDLYNIVPFSIHDRDRFGNYVAFVVGDNIDWDRVGTLDALRIKAYITYLSVLFWTRIDPRPEGQLTVVVDAAGFTFKRVLGGSVKTVLTAIASAINEVASVVGSRGGAVIFINSPRVLGPLLSLVSALLRDNIKLKSYSSRSSWEPALKQLIPSERLPVEYGGSSSVPLEHSAVSKKIVEFVLSFSNSGDSVQN